MMEEHLKYLSILNMWNDLNNKKPNECKTYLVYVHELNDLWCSSYIDIAFWDDIHEEFRKAHRISHWMEVPEVPTDEEMEEHIKEDKRRLRQYIANDF